MIENKLTASLYELNKKGVEALTTHSDIHTAFHSFTGCLKILKSQEHGHVNLTTERSHDRWSKKGAMLKTAVLPEIDFPGEENSICASVKFFNRAFFINCELDTLDANSRHILTAVTFYNIGITYHHMRSLDCSRKAAKCYELSLHVLKQQDLPFSVVGILVLALHNNLAHIHSLECELSWYVTNMEKVSKIICSCHSSASRFPREDINFFRLNTLLYQNKAFSVFAPAA